MPSSADPALDALLHPFLRGDLSWPQGRIRFLRARDGAALQQFPLDHLICEQSFKPEADVLARSGLWVEEGTDDTATPSASLVLVLPPRQRDEARALLARAYSLLEEGGLLVASVPNNEGAKTCEQDLASLAGLSGTTSKFHSRVFWTQRGAHAVDETRLAQWRTLDAPRKILGGRFLSRPGVFAWDRIDAASALLIENLPRDLSGHAADLGAGYGYLSSELLSRCPGITALDAYEAEARALSLARTNLRDATVPVSFHWHDVTAGLPNRYDTLIMNPPFHGQGRGDRPDIGQRFIAVAAESLNPGGRLWLVANRHLPYEAVLDERFGNVRTVAERGGFKVVEAIKAGRVGKPGKPGKAAKA